MKATRYSKIRHKDLSDWRVWLDAGKNRYQERGIWRTLDARLVALTFKLGPVLGCLARLALAILGSNRFEPSPIGNREYVNDLWKNDPAWLRALKWHIPRNPWCDLRKFYLGFGYALTVIHEPRNWGYIRWARFAWPRFRIPFPVFTCRFGHIGWEERGILSAGINLRG